MGKKIKTPMPSSKITREARRDVREAVREGRAAGRSIQDIEALATKRIEDKVSMIVDEVTIKDTAENVRDAAAKQIRTLSDEDRAKVLRDVVRGTTDSGDSTKASLWGSTLVPDSIAREIAAMEIRDETRKGKRNFNVSTGAPRNAKERYINMAVREGLDQISGEMLAEYQTTGIVTPELLKVAKGTIESGRAPLDVLATAQTIVDDHLRQQFKKVEALVAGRDRVQAQVDAIVPAAPRLKDNGNYVDDALMIYNFFFHQVQQILRQGKSADETFGAMIREMQAMWPSLAKARVFAVPPEVYQSVERYAHQVMLDIGGEKPTDDEGRQAWRDTIIDASFGAPYPDHLPFDSTLLVYGRGIPLSYEEIRAIFNDAEDKDLATKGMTVNAHLLTTDGRVWMFMTSDPTSDRRIAIMIPQIRASVGWAKSLAPFPWLVPGIINVVNSFKTFIHEQPRSMTFRKKWDKLEKNAKHQGYPVPAKTVPPYFYRVDLKQELVIERTTEWLHESRRRTWQLLHRVDVRAHERVRISRGALPIPEDVLKILEDRSYKVFTHNIPDQETSRLLYERHERPKAADEWVAVKVSWIKAHQRGPEDGPYIPALRVLPAAP